MGKWIGFLVVMIAAGVFVYKMFLGAPQSGTTDATAHAFVKAAVANDTAKIRALCTDSCADSAIEVASRLKALNPSVYAFTFQAMKTSSREAQTGLTAMFSGRILALEFAQVGKEWKIVSAQIAEE
jgi:hypothetical protein